MSLPTDWYSIRSPCSVKIARVFHCCHLTLPSGILVLSSTMPAGKAGEREERCLASISLSTPGISGTNRLSPVISRDTLKYRLNASFAKMGVPSGENRYMRSFWFSTTAL
ncbi:MAG: hypothetical protein A4E38_00075 [Methanoregulaceae archaeon PtaB.Bin108]|nr:MAG: hypothetical protein A4E38_00075 [Methanoregulaceae archaeon PtaB.Bin108]